MLARLAGSRTDVFAFCTERPPLHLAGSRVPPLTPLAIIRRRAPRHHAEYGVVDADLTPTIIEWAPVPSARR
jgi:hypothetical protein